MNWSDVATKADVADFRVSIKRWTIATVIGIPCAAIGFVTWFELGNEMVNWLIVGLIAGTTLGWLLTF